MPNSMFVSALLYSFFVSGSLMSSGGDPGGRLPVCLGVDWPVTVWLDTGASRSPGLSPDWLTPTETDRQVPAAHGSEIRMKTCLDVVKKQAAEKNFY